MTDASKKALAVAVAVLALPVHARDAGSALARKAHTAVMLRDGSVLVVGGLVDYPSSNGVPTAVVELFRPWAGWELLAPDPNGSGVKLSDGRGLLLPDGRALFVGKEVHAFDPRSRQWAQLPSLPQGGTRDDFTLTLLRDGRVLVVGGVDYIVSQPGQPLVGGPNGAGWQWASVTAGPEAQRRHHTATLLPGGGVLVVGGIDPLTGTTGVNQHLVFNPANNTLVPIDGGVPATRATHSATRRLSGEVVLFGDPNDSSTPASVAGASPPFRVTDAGRPLSAAYPVYNGHTAVLLTNGAVELAGGKAGLGAASAEVVHLLPDGTWLERGSLKTERAGHSATLLMDGKVLIVGGTDAGNPTWELRDPVGARVQVSAQNSVARPQLTATPTAAGELIVVGGEGATDDDVVVRVGSDGAFRTMPLGLPDRVGHTATLLTTDEVLVLGGHAPGSADELRGDCWLVSTGSADSARPCAPMPAARARHTATLLANGKVLVAGGHDATGAPSNEVWSFDPGAPNGGAWQGLSPMGSPRSGHAAVLLPDGEVLVAGGEGGLTSSELLSTALSWSQGPSLSRPRQGHTLTLLRDGRVLAAGGTNGAGLALRTIEVLTPGGGWTPGQGGPPFELDEPRARHAAVVQPTGDVFLAGAGDLGPDAGFFVSRFSPLTESFGTPAVLTQRRRSPALVIGNEAEVLVVGGGPASATRIARFRQALSAGEGGLSHGLTTPNPVFVAGQQFVFDLTGQWDEGPEATSGDHRASSVNVPRLLFQRLDNGQVVVPQSYAFVNKQLVGTVPDLAEGPWRAWAYVSGYPGAAAWFKVGLHPTSAWSPDGGAGDGGTGDGGVLDDFSLALAFEGEDPRLTLSRVETALRLTAPDGTPGSALELRLKPSPNLMVCEASSCAAVGAPVQLKLSGAVGTGGLDYPRSLGVRPMADGSHFLTAALVFNDDEVAWDSKDLQSVPVDLAPGACGNCASSPGGLALAAAGWVLLGLWRRKRRSP